MATRRKFADQFKAKAALEAHGDKTFHKIAAKHQVASYCRCREIVLASSG